MADNQELVQFANAELVVANNALANLNNALANLGIAAVTPAKRRLKFRRPSAL